MKNLFILLSLFSVLISCSSAETFECPCGGYGVVAHGSIITIDEKNEGDTEAILSAVESRLGGECCQKEEY
jgi:hypothetical protein